MAAILLIVSKKMVVSLNSSSEQFLYLKNHLGIPFASFVPVVWKILAAAGVCKHFQGREINQGGRKD